MWMKAEVAGSVEARMHWETDRVNTSQTIDFMFIPAGSSKLAEARTVKFTHRHWSSKLEDM